MGNEVEKFDPSTLMQGVKDRIKATFVSLIPDGQWEIMVQKEIDAFFEPVLVKHSEKKKQNISGYGYSGVEVQSDHTTNESPFRRLVWELCTEQTVTILKKKLEAEWFTNNWPITEQNMTDQLKVVVKEAAPVAMTRFFESLAMMYMNQLRQDIQDHRV